MLGIRSKGMVLGGGISKDDGEGRRGTEMRMGDF